MKKILIGIAAVLLLSSFLAPTFAWVHNDGTEDLEYDRYGPRMGTVLIHLYADDTAEWAALKAGDLDITDWPLSKTIYDELTAPPYDDVIGIANYGPEYGLFILDLNSNNNQYLGNPPDPAYVNPVADRDPGTGNPLIGGGAGPANDQNPMSDVCLRRAIGYLIDRPGLIADPTIGAGFGFPMYTTMPPAQPKYLLDVYGDPTMPWAWSYDPAAAAALLDTCGFPINTGTGYRFWDRNDDGVEQADEYVEILFYIRSDHPGRMHIGTVLVAEMAGIDLRVNPQFATSGACQIAVMINKDFHAYTGGWGLGVDPDHLILWSWDYYWHPGFCYNYGGHNHPDFNAAAAGIMYANDQAEAVMYAMLAQETQAFYCLGIPLYCASGNKAFYKTNTGGNPGDASEGEAWEDSFVNMAGYGIDNAWTMMNAHTEGPNGAPYYQPGVIDYGFKVPEIKMLNPVYASWLFDWNVLGYLYDSLLVRNASNLGEFTPWVAKYYELGTYDHPTRGTCTKIRFSIRDNFYWTDGTPLTTADVEFTFRELKNILSARGLPNPWWWSNVQDILSFSILDPYTFEVLLGVKSYWATGWIGGNIILPKHIWKPIAEAPGDPQTDQPDPHCIGSAGWRFVEYNDVAKYVKMVANTPGSDVDGIISTKGFAFFEAKKAKKHVVYPDYCSMRLPGHGPWEWTLDLDNNAAITWEQVFEKATVYVNNVRVWSAGAAWPGIGPTTVRPREQEIIDTFRCPVGGWQYGQIKIKDHYYDDDLFQQYINFTVTIPHIYRFELDLASGAPPDPDYAYPGYASEIKVEIQWRIVCSLPVLPIPYDVVFEERIYSTIKEDIAGSNLYDDIGVVHPYDSQLPSPDIKVDIKDVALAAKGFGSYPGHERWISVADINADYKIDIKDIAAIAKMFGWLPPLPPP